MKKDIKTLLQSSDPAQRREAIVTLGKTRDVRAMPILAKLYRSDPDPALRELARQAGQFIQEHAAEQTPPAPAPASTFGAESASEHVPAFSDPVGGPADDFGFDDDLEPSPSAGYSYESSAGSYGDSQNYGYGYVDDGGEDAHSDAVAAGWFDESSLPADAVAGSGLLKEEVYVSKQNMERAKSYYSRAFDLHLKNDRASAAKELGRALEINPNLVGDATVRNLAREIVHREPEESLTILRNRSRRDDFVREVQGKTRKTKDAAGGSRGVTWGDVGFDAIVYYLVNVIGVVVIFLAIMPMITRMSYELSQAGGPIMSIGPLAAIGIGLAFGLYTLVTTFISNGAVHFTAVMFGGEAILPESYHALFLPQTVMTGGVFALYALMMWLPDVASISSLVLFGASLGGLYWMSSRLASAHRFGAGKGCATLIVGPIILGILTCLGIWVLTTMLGVTLQQFAPAL
jgi:hypothetical protein